jgi:hypothetical protein
MITYNSEYIGPHIQAVQVALIVIKCTNNEASEHATEP